MGMEITNSYSNVYESAYAAQRQQTAKQQMTEQQTTGQQATKKTTTKESEVAKKAEETKGAETVRKGSGTVSSYDAYLGKLSKNVPSMSLHVGSSIPSYKDKRVGTLTINPSILAQMQNDSEKEEYYIQRMKDIERAEKLARGITNALGHTTVSSHWYIDQNGKIWHTAMTVRKDKLNEKLRKEAQENSEKLIEKTKEKAVKKKEELQELLEEKLDDSKDGGITFDEEEIQTIMEAVKEEKEESLKQEGEEDKKDKKEQPVVGRNLDVQV